MKNSESFVNELQLISDSELRNFINNVLDDLPDYFRKIGASTSGKFHPEYTIGEGGLIRHTKACVGIAKDLFRANIHHWFDDCIVNNNDEIWIRDCVYSALLLHDGLKCGMWEEKTAFNHPMLMSEFIKEKQREFNFQDDEFWSHISTICKCVESHMGRWNIQDGNDLILPLPTGIGRMVHLCDYLASRKTLEYKFDVNVDYVD